MKGIPYSIEQFEGFFCLLFRLFWVFLVKVSSCPEFLKKKKKVCKTSPSALKFSMTCSASETVILARTLQKADISVYKVLDTDLSTHLECWLKKLRLHWAKPNCLTFPRHFCALDRSHSGATFGLPPFLQLLLEGKISFQGHGTVEALLEILTSTPNSVWFFPFFAERKVEKVS